MEYWNLSTVPVSQPRPLSLTLDTKLPSWYPLNCKLGGPFLLYHQILFRVLLPNTNKSRKKKKLQEKILNVPHTKK